MIQQLMNRTAQDKMCEKKIRAENASALILSKLRTKLIEKDESV